MSETTEVLVESVTSKSGEKNGRSWTKYAIKDGNGNWYSTFDGTLIPDNIEGQRATIEYEVDGKFKNLLSVTVGNGTGLPSSQKPDGEADWDIIGLRKTRCHLWGEFFAGDACQSLIALFVKDKPDIKPSELAHNLLAVGRDLVRGAEVDVYHREPAEKGDDVPF